MSAPGPDARTRNALLRHLIAKLQPLYTDRDLRVELGGWLASLPVHTLAECLNLDPLVTADALAVALLGDDGSSDTQTQLAELAAVEYPRLIASRRARLAAFAATVRRIAIDGDGTCGAGMLLSEGFSRAEIDDLMPKATRLLGLLGGAARRLVRLPTDQTTPPARLARAGERFAARPLAA